MAFPVIPQYLEHSITNRVQGSVHLSRFYSHPISPGRISEISCQISLKPGCPGSEIRVKELRDTAFCRETSTGTPWQ